MIVAPGTCGRGHGEPRPHEDVTKMTAAVDRFEYTISKGSVSDRLFRFEEGDDSMMEGQDVCLHLSNLMHDPARGCGSNRRPSDSTPHTLTAAPIGPRD